MPNISFFLLRFPLYAGYPAFFALALSYFSFATLIHTSVVSVSNNCIFPDPLQKVLVSPRRASNFLSTPSDYHNFGIRCATRKRKKKKCVHLLIFFDLFRDDKIIWFRILSKKNLAFRKLNFTRKTIFMSFFYIWWDGVFLRCCEIKRNC